MPGEGSSGNALVPASSFQQQGTLEWVDLVKTSGNALIGFISRCSAAGVDPQTVAVGHAIASRFALTKVGRQHIEEALSGLHAFSSLGETLWFGFGITSLVRQLATTEQGQILLALCAGLMECYQEGFVAEVLLELTTVCNAPAELRPSLQQWKTLAVACSGVFAATSLPTRIEFFRRLHPEAAHYDPPGGYRQGQSVREEDMAEVILALARVSTRELASITVIGGSPVGWIAAMAEWIFGLTVNIIDSTGELVFTNCTPVAEAQFIWILDGANPSTGYSRPTTPSMEITGRTYHLRSLDSLVIGDGYKTVGGGRLDWEEALSRAFGESFELLVGIPDACGGAIGAAARILEGIANSEGGSLYFERLPSMVFCDSSYGRGFVEHVTHRFPELRPLKEDMEKAAGSTFDEAQLGYEKYISALRQACGCDSGHGPRRERVCHVILLETIIGISHSLSGVNTPPTLCPSRAGLELCYARHDYIRSMNPGNRSESIGFALDMHEIDRGEAHKGPVERLIQPLQIFTGRRIEPIGQIERTEPPASALCAGGLCAYFDIFHDISDDKESIGQVNIFQAESSWTESRIAH